MLGAALDTAQDDFEFLVVSLGGLRGTNVKQSGADVRATVPPLESMLSSNKPSCFDDIAKLLHADPPQLIAVLDAQPAVTGAVANHLGVAQMGDLIKSAEVVFGKGRVQVVEGGEAAVAALRQSAEAMSTRDKLSKMQLPSSTRDEPSEAQLPLLPATQPAAPGSDHLHKGKSVLHAVGQAPEMPTSQTRAGTVIVVSDLRRENKVEGESYRNPALVCIPYLSQNLLAPLASHGIGPALVTICLAGDSAALFFDGRVAPSAGRNTLTGFAQQFGKGVVSCELPPQPTLHFVISKSPTQLSRCRTTTSIEHAFGATVATLMYAATLARNVERLDLALDSIEERRRRI